MNHTHAFNWFFGPHMLGVVYLLIGGVQYIFPPKKINNWYGYRTPLSQSSQEAWDEGNRFAALYMVKLGVIFIIIGAITTTAVNLIPMPIKIKEVLTIFLFMISGIIPAILMLVATDKHLTKLFGNK